MQNRTSLRAVDLCNVIRWLLVAAIAFFPLTLFAQSDSDTAQSKQPALSTLLKTFHNEFVAITPGKGKFPSKFQMGSSGIKVIIGDTAIPQTNKHEGPVHEVTMKRPFAIARYELPQNLYKAVMGSNPSQWKGKRNRVEMVS